MIRVLEINDPAKLADHASLWKSLLEQTPGASFFQTFDWFQTWLAHQAAGAKLRVLIVFEGDEPLGIVPLVVRTVWRKLGPVRVLGYPLDNWGSFFGPIGSQQLRVLQAAFSHIRHTPRDWHLIELAAVDTAGHDQSATENALASSGIRATCEAWQTSALIDLSAFDSWDAYWAGRASHWRTNVRRSEKKLSAVGRVSHLRYRPLGAAHGQSDPRWDLYEACEEIARTSWQGDSDTGTTLSHESVRGFLRDCHATAARVGALDLNLLLVDDRPVAFNYAYQHAGYVFGLRTGFDRAAVDGAGSVLQARMIADSIERGDRTYDLGPGYLACKRHWLTQARTSYRYTHFAAGAPVAQFMRAKRAVSTWWNGAATPVATEK